MITKNLLNCFLYSSVKINKCDFILNLTHKKNEKNLKMFVKNSPIYFFKNKQQQKNYLILFNTQKNKNYGDYHKNKYINNLILARFLLFKNHRNKKKKTQPKTLIFNFFKNYLRTFIYLIKHKKMYKFSNDVNRFVFKPNFNIIKRKQTVVRFSKLGQKIKIKKKKKLIKKKKFITKFLYFLYFLIFY